MVGARAATTASTALALIVIGGVVLAVAREPRVSMWSPGRIGTAPADWWVNVTVDPDPAHRLLVVITDGQPGEYRRSDYVLNGDKAARIRQHWEKALSAGCYHFYARVFDASQEIARAEAGPVAIIGMEGNPCPE